MTFQEACQQVINTKAPSADYDTRFGIWRMSWPQDTILGFNEKKNSFIVFPAASVFLDTITSRSVVFSLTKTEQVSYIGWLPSADDLSATDWESNVPRDTPEGVS